MNIRNCVGANRNNCTVTHAQENANSDYGLEWLGGGDINNHDVQHRSDVIHGNRKSNKYRNYINLLIEQIKYGNQIPQDAYLFNITQLPNVQEGLQNLRYGALLAVDTTTITTNKKRFRGPDGCTEIIVKNYKNLGN